MRKFAISSMTILEPLLLFLAHAIRMRDTRCCGIVLRIYRSLVPEFASDRNTPVAPAIREFISTDVLKACISSLNEPYFVDLHKDIAQLIATIIMFYTPHTNTPREILLSLPGIDEKAVNKCTEYIMRQGMQQRQQRALVLDLLRDIKGVSISEQGRITKTPSQAKKERSKMQQEFLKEHPAQNSNDRQPSPNFEGVANMLEEV
jgi:exportin-5